MSALQRHHVTAFGPDRAVVILVHGYSCDQRIWHRIVPSVAASNRVVTYDLAGCGGTDPASYDFIKYRSLEGHASDLLDIHRELGLAGSDVTVIGHSVGSIVALLAANRTPAAFSRLVMINPSPRYTDDGDYVGGLAPGDVEEMLAALEADYARWARTMTPHLMRNPKRPELGLELADIFSRADPVVAAHFAKAIFRSDYRAEVRGNDLPTLIVQCPDDLVAPLAVGQWLHRNMARSLLVMLDATGHYPHLSAPRETIEVIQTFLEG